MAEAFLRLSQDDQREVLEIVREKTQRPTLLLEKDVWVVWSLGALFDLALADDLTSFYSPVGRPSIDLELMIRMLIVGYCFGICSERRLCEEAHLNLA